jgi:[acyl-carrier-protein] S-malonyltransferase
VLSAAPFRDPAVPVISNVTGKAITAADALGGELTDQVTSPVLWLEDVRTMIAAGVTDFVEFGPGRVLTGQLRRTDPSVRFRNVGTAAEARGAATE